MEGSECTTTAGVEGTREIPEFIDGVRCRRGWREMRKGGREGKEEARAGTMRRR